MYTVKDFNEYVSSVRGTGRTSIMIDKIVSYVEEDPENNVPQIMVMNLEQGKLIQSMLSEKGVKNIEIVTSDGTRVYGKTTTNTFFDHSVAEYNMNNALTIYESQIKDSQ